MSEVHCPWGILCTSGDHSYQLAGDASRLYLIRLGPADAAAEASLLHSPAQFRPGPRALSIPKESITSVRCAETDEDMTLIVSWGGRNRRFFAEPGIPRSVLTELFSGTPLRFSGQKRSAPEAKADPRLQLILLIACVAVAVLRFLLSLLGATAVVPILSLLWLAIPPIWAFSHARGGLKSMHLDAGSAAAFLSCLSMLITPAIKPDSPVGLIPAGLAIGVAACAAWVVPRRGVDITLAAVLGASLLIYAPCAALCINQLSSTVIDSNIVSIEEIANVYEGGEWYYYATVDQYGVDSEYQISRSDYARIAAGATAEVRRVRGLLGCITTEIRITDGTATNADEPVSTEETAS